LESGKNRDGIRDSRVQKQEAFTAKPQKSPRSAEERVEGARPEVGGSRRCEVATPYPGEDSRHQDPRFQMRTGNIFGVSELGAGCSSCVKKWIFSHFEYPITNTL
jgi:hypothetical protein